MIVVAVGIWVLSGHNGGKSQASVFDPSKPLAASQALPADPKATGPVTLADATKRQFVSPGEQRELSGCGAAQGRVETIVDPKQAWSWVAHVFTCSAPTAATQVVLKLGSVEPSAGFTPTALGVAKVNSFMGTATRACPGATRTHYQSGRAVITMSVCATSATLAKLITEQMIHTVSAVLPPS